MKALPAAWLTRGLTARLLLPLACLFGLLSGLRRWLYRAGLLRVAKLPLPQWAEFIDQRPELKEDFEYEVMHLMSEVMAHTITLHLLDAPGRVHRFLRKHPELAERVPKKELASYLNLSAETLSRLKHAGKI